jgi:hypothetical protein
MEIEVAGNAAIWPERSVLRVVLLSRNGLEAGAQRTQRRVMSGLMQAGTHGVLYDARQVDAGQSLGEWGAPEDWIGWGRVALVSRSQWFVFWKNLSLYWRGSPVEIRAFRDDYAAKKWLMRSRPTAPHQGFTAIA